jgi:hypothetical protein
VCVAWDKILHPRVELPLWIEEAEVPLELMLNQSLGMRSPLLSFLRCNWKSCMEEKTSPSSCYSEAKFRQGQGCNCRWKRSLYFKIISDSVRKSREFGENVIEGRCLILFPSKECQEKLNELNGMDIFLGRYLRPVLSCGRRFWMGWELNLHKVARVGN